jgi:glycosyltransferase involved in cell wall biosynthesis
LHIQDIYPEAFLNKLPSWIGSFVYQLLIPIERFVTKQSTRIVTISKGMSKLLTETRNLPSSKIEVIYNWQDETKYLVDAQLESSSSTAKFTHFMFLGSLGPVANIDNLIRAFAQLSKDEIFFTITGEGSEKVKLQKLAQKLNASNILFKLAPSSEVGQIQASAHILLLSLKKGAAGLALPSKLPAYMLSAKPIIATVDLNSDTAEAIREAGCGWVIEPEQPEILAKLIKEIQEMPKSELIIMGAKGREYAMKHFSKKNNLSKLVDNIENLLKR